MRIREKAEIRKVAKYIAVAYLLTIVIPELLSYFIIDLASSYRSLKIISTVFTDPVLSMIYQIVVSAVIFTLPFLVVPMRLGLRLKELVSARRPEKGLTLPLLLMGIGFCAFANLAANTITGILGGFGIEVYSPTYASAKTLPEFILTFIAVGITPAIVEEFAFRGVVLGALRRFGDGFAILVSSLVFGLMHRNLSQIPFAFLVGIIMAFAVIKSGSLITSILIHLLNNGISVVISTVTEQMGNDMAVTVIYSLYFSVCLIFFFMGLGLLSGQGKEFWKPKRAEHILTTRQRVICFFSQPIMILNIALSILTALTLIIIT